MSADSHNLPAQGLKILIIGFGSIGRRHYHNFKNLGCSNFVFCRTGRGTIDDAETSDYPRAASVQEALSHRPDVAVVANPTALHVEAALAAARAGCDLLIEKPLSHSMQGCEELLDAVRVSNRVAMIGCQYRFHPLLIRLRDAIQAGRLGTVLAARAEWGEHLPNWHPWEDHRSGYAARADLGGGVVLTLIHPLDYLYWMFGPVESVQAGIRSVPALDTPAGEDWAHLNLQFESGVLAQVELDYWRRPTVHQLAVRGENGSAVWDYHDGSLCWIDCEGGEEIERLPKSFDRNDMFIQEAEHFLECVAERKPSRIPLEDGVAVLDVALKAKENAQSS